MARQVLVLEEVLAILQQVGVSAAQRATFESHAEEVLGQKLKSEKATDELTVSSGFGQKSQVGYVELTLNDTRTQMPAPKAREVGLMLIEAAEAAASDQMFVILLNQLGLEDRAAHARILLELREIRQGTKETAWPS